MLNELTHVKSLQWSLAQGKPFQSSVARRAGLATHPQGRLGPAGSPMAFYTIPNKESAFPEGQSGDECPSVLFCLSCCADEATTSRAIW